MKVVINYKIYGAIEVDLLPGEAQRLTDEKDWDNYLVDVYSFQEVKDNLSDDGDDTVVTSVTWLEGETLYNAI